LYKFKIKLISFSWLSDYHLPVFSTSTSWQLYLGQTFHEALQYLVVAVPGKL